MPPFLTNIPVLCFHDLATPEGMTLTRFCAHLDVIEAMGFTTISGQKLLAICSGQTSFRGKPIVITFDDCHVSNWIHAIPELRKRSMHGIFFAITDFITNGPARTEQTAPTFLSAHDSFTLALAHNDCSQFMTREELISAIADHGMEVYSHSSRHQGCFRRLTRKVTVSDGHWSSYGIYDRPQGDWPTYERGSAYAYNGFWPTGPGGTSESFHKRSDQERFDFCVQDFTRSLKTIQTINGARSQLICWPWGEFDAITIKAARKAGFAGAFNLDRFYNGTGTDPFHLHRIPVTTRKTPQWLRTRLRMHASRPGAILFSKFFRKK
ncbi:polysaccharide deacetylase family protein [Desulfoplanes sp. PS50]